MGPITKLWVVFDKTTKDPNDQILPSAEECLTLIEQTVLLVGQSGNLFTFERRKNALSTIYWQSHVTSILKEKSEVLKKWSPDLLGKSFRDDIVEAMKAKRESLKALKGENKATYPMFKSKPSS